MIRILTRAAYVAAKQLRLSLLSNHHSLSRSIVSSCAAGIVQERYNEAGSKTAGYFSAVEREALRKDLQYLILRFKTTLLQPVSHTRIKSGGVYLYLYSLLFNIAGHNPAVKRHDRSEYRLLSIFISYKKDISTQPGSESSFLRKLPDLWIIPAIAHL